MPSRPFRLLWLAAAFCLTQRLPGQVLYVGNTGDNTISTYIIDQESGFLTEVGPRVASQGIPQSLAVHPSGKFAYVTNFGGGGFSPNLAAYAIDPGTGALTFLSSSTAATGSLPQGMVIHPSGQFALVAHQGANYVSVFSIDASTGATTPVPGSPFATPQTPTSIVVHPNGKFAYVGAAGAGQIVAFNIGSDGALAPVDGSPFSARNNLVGMAMDAAGKFLFAAERQDSAVLAYSVDAATGALTQVGSPFPAGISVSGVAVDPAGKFLYASNSGSGSVTVFSIGDTGALTRRGDFGALVGASAAILNPSGKFLYVPGQGANAIGGYSIDPDSGVPALLPQEPVATGVQPQRGVAVLLTPPVLPAFRIDTVYNYFSHALPGMPNAAIAQGARLAISGKNIGPAMGVFPSDFPLPIEIGGVSVQIQSDGVTTAAFLYFASSGFITCVVPSATPVGDATLTVTYNGRTTPPFPIKVAANSVGIRTLNDGGNGPAKAFNVPPGAPFGPAWVQTPNTLIQSAKPGQTVVLHIAGLGPVTADETQDFLEELDVPADVFVGNKSATVVAELAVSTGTGYIAFKLPDDVPEGCYVPIAIRAGGLISNTASISISASGGTCSDATGLSASDIDAAQKSGRINMASILITHLDPLDDEVNGRFTSYDFDSLLVAFAPGAPQFAVRRSFGTPPLGSCTVSPGTATDLNHVFRTASDPITGQLQNVGPALNLSGPPGDLQLTLGLPGPTYQFYSVSSFIKPGDYTVDNGTGTSSFGPFKASLSLPSLLTWTNEQPLASVNRDQDLTVTWTSGVADKEFALIVGISVSNQVTTGFLCAEKVSAGKFTVPAWVLANLPASTTFNAGDQALPAGLLAVGTAAFTSAGRFTAPGFDFGVFTYEQAAATLVSFR